jgi:hypothetical protein
MKYGVSWIDPVYDILERAAASAGLHVYRSDDAGGLAQPVLEKVYSEINKHGQSAGWAEKNASLASMV